MEYRTDLVEAFDRKFNTNFSNSIEKLEESFNEIFLGCKPKQKKRFDEATLISLSYAHLKNTNFEDGRPFISNSKITNRTLKRIVEDGNRNGYKLFYKITKDFLIVLIEKKEEELEEPKSGFRINKDVVKKLDIFYFNKSQKYGISMGKPFFNFFSKSLKNQKIFLSDKPAKIELKDIIKRILNNSNLKIMSIRFNKIDRPGDNFFLEFGSKNNESEVVKALREICEKGELFNKPINDIGPSYINSIVFLDKNTNKRYKLRFIRKGKGFFKLFSKTRNFSYEIKRDIENCLGGLTIGDSFFCPESEEEIIMESLNKKLSFAEKKNLSQLFSKHKFMSFDKKQDKFKVDYEKYINHLRQNFLRGNFYCRKHKLVRKEEEIFIEGYKLIRKKDNKKAFLYINKREDTLYKKKLNFMDQQSYPIFIIDFKEEKTEDYMNAYIRRIKFSDILEKQQFLSILDNVMDQEKPYDILRSNFINALESTSKGYGKYINPNERGRKFQDDCNSIFKWIFIDAFPLGEGKLPDGIFGLFYGNVPILWDSKNLDTSTLLENTLSRDGDIKDLKYIIKFRKEYKNLKYYCYILSSAISESELKKFKEEVSNQINSFNKKEKGMLRRIKFKFITRKAILEISNHFKDENKKLLFERNHPKFCEHFESKLRENEIIDSLNLKDFFDEISRLSTPDTSKMRKIR